MRLVVISLIVFSIDCHAQCVNCEEGVYDAYCYGADKAETQLHMAKFMDYTHMDRIDDALPEINWLLDNAPCLNICLYTPAEKYITKVLSSTQDRRSRKEYKQLLKRLAELRTKYFGEAIASHPCWEP